MVRKSLRCRRASRSKIALRWIGKSTEHVIGIGRPHIYNHNRLAIDCQENSNFRLHFCGDQCFRLRCRQRRDGQIRR